MPRPARTPDDHQRYLHLPEPGRVGGAGRPALLTFEQLEREGRVGMGGEHWINADERQVGARAIGAGIDVVSVQPVPGRKTPDAALVAVRRTIELKKLDTPSTNALVQRARDGRKQSRLLFITGLTVGLDRKTAWAGLYEMVRKYGLDLDEVLVEYAAPNGPARIHWP